MRDKHGIELMPLWKCKIADFYTVVAAWNRKDAERLLKEKTNLITGELDLTRLKGCFGKIKEAKILVI